MWDLLRWQRHKHHRRLDNAEAIADKIAGYARSYTPLGLEALGILRRLTFADVLAGLASHELERRRRAAYQLGWQAWGTTETAPQGLLGDAAGRLLSDTDPLLRLHGVAVVRWLRPARMYPLLRELQKTETDPWVQDHLSLCLSEQPLPEDDFLASAAQEGTGQPLF